MLMETPKLPKVTLEAWIALNYGEGSRPSIKTVRRWNADGRLLPAAVKEGRNYYIPSNAQYIDPRAPASGPRVVERIRRAAQKKTR